MAERVQRSCWGDAGGIAALADLIDTHRGAFEYDWRARFHLPLRAIGRGMSYGEALRLTERLAVDPESHVGAALAGWDAPTSRATLALMDLYDLQHQVAWAQGGGKGARPKPYPRPWAKRTTKRTKPSLSQDQIIAALHAAGHTAPLPTRASEVIPHG